MSAARVRRVLFGLVGAASAVFVHFLPAPWELEATRSGAAVAPSATAGPAPSPVASGPPLRGARVAPETVAGVPAVAADAPSVLSDRAPQAPGAAVPGIKASAARP